MKNVLNIFGKSLRRLIGEQTDSSSASVMLTSGAAVESKGGAFTLSGSMIDARNIDFAKAMIKKNVLRITTIEAKDFSPIKAELLPLIEEEVIRSMQPGGGRLEFKKNLQKICGITDKEAALIARDQTAKFYSQMTMENMRRAGITKARWLHSGAGRAPRDYHRTKWDGVSHNPPNGLNGYVFDVNNPPIADLETGERTFPGVLLDCKCIAMPIIDI